MWTGSIACWRINVAAIMRALMLPLLLGWSAASTAAPRCAPFQESGGVLGEIVAYSLTDPEGPYLIWQCAAIPDDLALPATVTLHCIEAPWSAVTLRNLGDRADTVRNAADPVAAFFASYKRHVTGQSARCAALLAAP